MGDLSQTEGDVYHVARSGPIAEGTSGEAIDAGMPVYQLATDGKWYRCLITSGKEANMLGVCISTVAAADLDIKVALPPSIIDLGATLVVGQPYFCSDTTTGGGGFIFLDSDLATGDHVTYVGTARTTRLLKLVVDVTGVEVA